MHPSHPYIAQEVSRGSARENNRVREKLFAQGKGIDRALYQAKQAYQESKTEEMRLQLAVAVGATEAYVKIRRALAPSVGSDQLTKTLNHKAKAGKDILSE